MFVLDHPLGIRNLNPYNFCIPNYVKTRFGELEFPLIVNYNHLELVECSNNTYAQYQK